MLVWILIMIGSVLLDQISKLLVYNFLDREESLYLIKGVLRFTYVENDGAAFGMLGEHRWIFMILSTIGIAAVLIYMWKFRPESKLACTALAFIVGGGVGNMIDRVRLGYVIDFIDFCAFPKVWMWVFNIADSFVCVGAGILILYLIMDIIKEGKQEKLKKAGATLAEVGIDNAEQGESEND